MKVSFLSIDNEKNRNFFTSEAVESNGELAFIDGTTKDTTIHLIKINSDLKLIRDGSVKMEMLFSLNNKTKGYYHNEMGLEFEFDVYCKELVVEKNKYVINYDMIMDNVIQNQHKIIIKID